MAEERCDGLFGMATKEQGERDLVAPLERVMRVGEEVGSCIGGP